MIETLISFSGGVESTTMCVLWGDKAKAIFADTGWEHAAMYERIDRVEKKIKEIHPGFEVVRVKKNDGLVSEIQRTKFFPSPNARYCTRMFKIEPIDKFLKDQGEVELLIGLNADESNRVGNHGMMANVKYSYPLIENNINRAACREILQKVGLDVEGLPPYMTRGGCKGCFYKRKAEFIAMRLLAPDEFAEVEALENEIQDERGSYYALESNGHTMESMRQEADSAMFTPEEMYQSDQVSTPCGVFCHR